MCERRIFVTLRVAGFHAWPEANAEVGYLASPHRHLFHFKVEWSVSHNERNVEFHTAQRWIHEALATRFGAELLDFGARSCESIAEWLHDALAVKPCVVEISEDGECGARLEWAR